MPSVSKKKCTRCGKIKKLGDYYSNGPYLAACCKICENIRRKKNMRTPTGRYASGKQNAEQRGHAFTISLNEFTSLINNPCSYCGKPLSETGVGLDRIDSNKGYIEDNVTPCCNRCNVAKGNMSLDEFFSHLEAMYKHSIVKLQKV